MIWKGRSIVSAEELMLYGIDRCASKIEAQEFMRVYLKENKHAKENIGYLAGYYNTEAKHRIFDWFDVVHPIFGTKDPTPEEALRLGMQWAKGELSYAEQPETFYPVRNIIRE